jgi:SAM-dependent methyltransferase
MQTMTSDEITFRVKEFYENNPYPGTGYKLLFKDAERLAEYMRVSGKTLFPGCGTGHTMVALGSLRPDLELYGLDISAPSLRIARELADTFGVRVDAMQGDITQPLPWGFKFKYIILQGTLHHIPDPNRALQNLVSHLAEDGLIFINLYGKKYHRRRLEIIEMLDLLQQTEAVKDLKQRFELYRSLMGKKKNNLVESLANISPKLIWRWLSYTYRQLKMNLTRRYDSIPWTTDFRRLDQLWIDQYAHPYEKTYDMWETKQLIESANLEIVEMMYLGKIRIDDLPETWRPLFKKLDSWSQRRIMELYYPSASSIYLWARQVDSSSNNV